MPSVDVSTALTRIQGQEAWAVIRLGSSDTAFLVGGTLERPDRLTDIDLPSGPPAPGRQFDRLLAVPYRQVAERGFVAYDDGTPLAAVAIESEYEVPLADLVAALPQDTIDYVDRGGFETSDEDYAEVVRTIIADEIGNGEGANLVVGRRYRAHLQDWNASRALSVLRRLLENERGAYWTYVFFTGDRYLIGASPERHVSVAGGEVRMNPISGTFRLRDLADLTTAQRKQKLLDFLADEKEIYELYMVVDEELKMMCDICDEGGQVLGPFLKPMTHLLHTEYLLAGRTSHDVREVLRDTMFAATVTGAPVENACRLIAHYEPKGRGYYSGALALLGRQADGTQTCDSPIIIRTADVSLDGHLTVTAGATLVRDSDPHHEVAETHAKAGGILTAFGLVEARTGAVSASDDIAMLTHDDDVMIALNARNQRLAPFWLTDQSDAATVPALAGKKVAILHGEDDFVNMLARVFGVFGMEPTILRHVDGQFPAFDSYDLVVVGPGPGDPRDDNSLKIKAFRGAVADLIATQKPFLAVCLGHQTLCRHLGIELGYKDIVFQGTQSEVLIDGSPEKVGFYNTFVGRLGDALPDGVEVQADEAGDIHLVKGPHYRGVQFHAESILTQNGHALLRNLLVELLGQ